MVNVADPYTWPIKKANKERWCTSHTIRAKKSASRVAEEDPPSTGLSLGARVVKERLPGQRPTISLARIHTSWQQRVCL